MANYDITFRFPGSFTLVATGKQVSLQQEGGQSVGHWVSDGPIPIAGFNLGRYIKTTATAGDVIVNSYATRGVEDQMARSEHVVPAQTSSSAMTPEGITSAPAPPPTSPVLVAAGLSLAKRAAASVTSLASMLGPFPFSTLSLTQRPGTDSQGWPGIIFLSSYVYLSPEERAAAHVPLADSVLYGEVMMPHEVAHQWFGDRVSWASYHEQWLLEAISNYAAIMLMEPRRPADMQIMLQAYRQLLASKPRNGLNNNVQAGPVTLGVRLSSSKFPGRLRDHHLRSWNLAHSHASRDVSRCFAINFEPGRLRRSVPGGTALDLRTISRPRDYERRFPIASRGGSTQVALVREPAFSGLVF